MKKTFGIILLIIGVTMIGFGIAALTDLAARNDSFEGRIKSRLNETYQTNNEEQQAVGIGLIVGGAILFIIGIVRTASKSERKESPIEIMEKQRRTRSEKKLTEKTKEISNELITQLEMLGKLKEQGIINEREFQEQKKKILG